MFARILPGYSMSEADPGLRHHPEETCFAAESGTTVSRCAAFQALMPPTTLVIPRKPLRSSTLVAMEER